MAHQHKTAVDSSWTQGLIFITRTWVQTLMTWTWTQTTKTRLHHSPPGRLQCCSSLRQNVELSKTSMTATEPSTRPTSSESIVRPRQPSISPLLWGHASAVTQCGWTSKWPLWPPTHRHVHGIS